MGISQKGLTTEAQRHREEKKERRVQRRKKDITSVRNLESLSHPFFSLSFSSLCLCG